MENINRMCANCLKLGKGCKGTTCQTWTGCIYRTTKRYRDAAGRLTMPVDQIAAATLDEAKAYYQDGGQYIHEGLVYTLHRCTSKDAHGDAVEMAQFTNADGYNLFADPARLGTFLPGVASDGQEIARV